MAGQKVMPAWSKSNGLPSLPIAANNLVFLSLLLFLLTFLLLPLVAFLSSEVAVVLAGIVVRAGTNQNALQ